VVTAAADGNWYVRWFIRDRLNLIERTNLVFWMHLGSFVLASNSRTLGLDSSNSRAVCAIAILSARTREMPGELSNSIIAARSS